MVARALRSDVPSRRHADAVTLAQRFGIERHVHASVVRSDTNRFAVAKLWRAVFFAVLGYVVKPDRQASFLPEGASP